jgi:hypothetical protein
MRRAMRMRRRRRRRAAAVDVADAAGDAAGDADAAAAAALAMRCGCPPRNAAWFEAAAALRRLCGTRHDGTMAISWSNRWVGMSTNW